MKLFLDFEKLFFTQTALFLKIIQLLNGEEGPYRDIVLLNSAAALYVDDKVKNIKDGMELSRYSIDKGLAKSALEKLKEISNS